MVEACKKDQIRRSAYVRKAYVRKDGVKVKRTVVPASCIKDVGEKGKGKKIAQLKEGLLKKYGYSSVKDLSPKERHNALARAIKAYDALSVYRKVNILVVLNKNRENLRKIFDSDRAWIKKNYKI